MQWPAQRACEGKGVMLYGRRRPYKVWLNLNLNLDPELKRCDAVRAQATPTAETHLLLPDH